MCSNFLFCYGGIENELEEVEDRSYIFVMENQHGYLNQQSSNVLHSMRALASIGIHLKDELKLLIAMYIMKNEYSFG